MLNIKRLGFVFVLFACFFTSKNFNAQKINQFNANNQRIGVWKKYHPNKRIRYEGRFKDGKEVGVFKFYDITDSKNPTTIKIYSRNSNKVDVRFYTVKGVLQSKGVFVDRKRAGKWEYYFPNGKVMSEEFYVDGKLDGKLTNFYPNGKPTEISMYKNGLKNGESQKYSSKGILIELITYQNGKPNGIAKYFELNGNLKEIGTYNNGKRVGKWEYYLDGQVSEKDDFKKKTFIKEN